MRPVNHDVLANGFNKGLVKRQLKACCNFTVSSEIEDEMNRVKDLWVVSGDTVETRVKFILVDWISMVAPFYVLVSEYSKHCFKGTKASMDMFLIRYHGETQVGMAIPEVVIYELGGKDRVARMLSVGGMELVLNSFKNTQRSELIGPIIESMRQMLAIEKKGIGL